MDLKETDPLWRTAPTASGAGAESRHSLGTAVFGGMILSTFLSLIVVPVFYVIIQSIRENGWKFYKTT